MLDLEYKINFHKTRGYSRTIRFPETPKRLIVFKSAAFERQHGSIMFKPRERFLFSSNAVTLFKPYYSRTPFYIILYRSDITTSKRYPPYVIIKGGRSISAQVNQTRNRVLL